MRTITKQRIATLLIERTGETIKQISLTCQVSGGQMSVLCPVSIDTARYSEELRGRFDKFRIQLQTIEIQLN